MYPDHDDHVSSVPVTIAAFTIIYCHQCQAWRLTAWATTTHSESDSVTLLDRQQDFGPFDDFADVGYFLNYWVEQLGALPAAPWVRA